MLKFKFAKLIRCKLVNLLKNGGVIVNSISLSEKDYINSLKAKILEEAAEVANSNNQEELIEELGDLIEVIKSLIAAGDIDPDLVEKVRLDKKSEKGGFNKDSYVESIQIDQDNQNLKEYSKYYLQNPEKYPQIK